jgi:uncharacterized phage-associated protein
MHAEPASYRSARQYSVNETETYPSAPHGIIPRTPHSEFRGRHVYRAIDVAQTIVDVAYRQGKYLTPMQLIKLVYLSHGWMLGLYGIELLDSRERIEAWRYGPVIPELYQAIRTYRDQPVTAPIMGARSSLDNVAQDLVEQVFDRYGIYDGLTLSKITHLPKSPWSTTWTAKKTNQIISNQKIRDYYAELAQLGRIA